MMKGLWPFGVARSGEASNHLMLRWLNTVVVSDEEKALVEASDGERQAQRDRQPHRVLCLCRSPDYADRDANRLVARVTGRDWSA